MAQELTADVLAPHLTGNPDLIDRALAELYAGAARKLNMDGVRAAAEMVGVGPAMQLVSTLKAHATIDAFLSFMRAQGVELIAPVANDLVVDRFDGDLDGLPLQDLDDTVDHAGMARFATRSQAFRCRIRVGGQVMGSGALVSPRLVLTAAHVVQAALDAADADNPPKIEVMASDQRTYEARKAFASPCHPDEHNGAFPPADEADSHIDVALLRVEKPIGRLYGHIKLPDQPAHWDRNARFVLVHFPGGQESGFSMGAIKQNDGAALRLPHNVMAAGGSSGGPGFNKDFTFLGIHQGKFGNFRRIVPYDRFAANDDFQAALKKDKPPRYLWSLDGSLDSHLIIGRGLFFDAISAMVEGEAPHLRGIWVRRIDPEVTAGLSFSHELLAGYLRAHGKAHDIHRIPMSLGITDLVTHLSDAIGDVAAPGAAQGVAAGQTTDVAHDDNRMRRLVDQLDARAAAAGETMWLYVDNPPSGMLAETQIQLEHLVQAVLTRPHLRIVIAGYETIGLVNRLAESVAGSRRIKHPHLLVEFLSHFTRRDVALTIKEICHTLDLKKDQPVIDHIADVAVRGLTDDPNAHVFEPRHLRAVSDAVRQEIKRII